MVVCVRWCPKRPAVFFASDSARNVYVFDLVVDVHAPVSVEKLPAGRDGNSTLVDISTVSSSANATNNSCFALVASCTGNSPDNSGSGDGVASLRVGKINPLLLEGNPLSKGNEEAKLRAELCKWV
jgi:hypothetical protein